MRFEVTVTVREIGKICGKENAIESMALNLVSS